MVSFLQAAVVVPLSCLPPSGGVAPLVNRVMSSGVFRGSCGLRVTLGRLFADWWGCVTTVCRFNWSVPTLDPEVCSVGSGLPWYLSWWRIYLQCRRPGFDPWVGEIPSRRERLPTPVFWPGEFHGLYSPWGHKHLDMTECLSLQVTKMAPSGRAQFDGCSLGLCHQCPCPYSEPQPSSTSSGDPLRPR